MASDVADKWTCPQCTYENFPTANACTMCRTPQCSVLIIEPPCTSDTKCATANSPHRWPCPQCTYLNVIKARRCTVCSNRRPSYYDQDEDHLRLKDEFLIDVDEANKLGKALRKWDCSQCTYKNWPSVKHCVMCNASKDFISIGVGCDEGVKSKKEEDIARDCLSVDNESERVSQLPKKVENEDVEYEDSLSEIGHGATLSAIANVQPEIFAKEVTFLQRYLLQIRKCVDTGCVSFLEAFVEILHQTNKAEEKLIRYIYHYGDGNRRINTFESMLINEGDEDGGLLYYNHTLMDLIRDNSNSYINCIPRFFLDTLTCNVALPGAASGDRSDEIHKKIRESMFEDYDVTRVPNNNALFSLPNAVHELRPWISSGESSLRVLIDFDDRKLLETICCMDTHSLAMPVNRQTYVPTVLRNRGGGHSLVDAVSQALWGVIDKSNTLRDAIYHTLYSLEAVFRSRWASSLMKRGLKFDIWMMQRYWTNIMECQEPGAPLEQIHVLVLAQILNRTIIVLPIESSKFNHPPKNGRRDYHKHPMEGFYTPLTGTNTFRLCPPLLIGFSNGNFHALILPSRPVLGRADVSRSSHIYRYIRFPPFPSNHYVQFAMNDNEAEELIKDCIVIEMDANRQKWIYHSTHTHSHPKTDLGTLLWKDWIKTNFPKAVRDECEDALSVAEGNITDGNRAIH